jgi:hypothetical protein
MNELYALRRALFGACMMLVLLLAGCKQSSDVVSDRFIQKRKHRAGWHLNVGAPSKHRLDQAEKATRLLPAYASALPEEDGPAQEGLDSTHPMKKRIARLPSEPSLRDLKNLRSTQDVSIANGYHVKEIKALEPKMNLVDEEPETPESFSMLTKLLIGLAMLFLLGAIIAFFIWLFAAGATGMVLTAWLILLGASVFSFLMGLLMAYIIYETYDDDEPMQWVWVAAYVYGAIIAILSSIFYLGIGV